MEAKELRIGNYFIYNTDGCFPNNPEWESNTITVVRQIKEGGVGITHLKNMENGGVTIGGLGLIKPIPLSEKWLLKFGFDEITPKYYVLNIDDGNSFTYYYTFSGGVWHFEFEGISIKIKYVHELQNLYYALTKKELTIKK